MIQKEDKVLLEITEYEYLITKKCLEKFEKFLVEQSNDGLKFQLLYVRGALKIIDTVVAVASEKI